MADSTLDETQSATAGSDVEGTSAQDQSRINKLGSRLSHFAACAPCRKRKLRCDGKEPTCSTCSRVGRECLYVDIRKGTRKQRTSIKILEARLAELESRDKPQSNEEPGPAGSYATGHLTDSPAINEDPQDFDSQSGYDTWANPGSMDDVLYPDVMPGVLQQNDSYLPSRSVTWETAQTFGMATSHSNVAYSEPLDKSSTDESGWRMMGMGQHEALPPQAVQDFLFLVYFERIDPYFRAVHQARFLAGMSLPSSSRLRPPLCLCYAMWTLGAFLSEPYKEFHDYFYQHARKYLESDELKGRGEFILTVQHAQAWCLVSMYESMLGYFSRGFFSSRKASALCIALGIQKLDGVGLSSTQTQALPSDWIELEQRRRTFWMIFAQDRFVNVASGFPLAIDERDVQTRLPSSDNSFIYGTPGHNMSLKEAMLPAEGAASMCSLAKISVIATLFGRIMSQLHRNDPDETLNDDVGNAFWQTFRQIENTLANFQSSLQASNASGFNISDPTAVFLTISVPACMICLHQAALFKAGKLPRLRQQSIESKLRCMEAAREVVNNVKNVHDSVISKMGPFTPFCLYTAMRVFVLASKEVQSEGSDMFHSEQRVLAAKIQVLRRVMPYIQYLLSQLGADFAGVDDLNPIGHVTLPIDELTIIDTVEPAPPMPDSISSWSSDGQAAVITSSSPFSHQNGSVDQSVAGGETVVEFASDFTQGAPWSGPTFGDTSMAASGSGWSYMPTSLDG